LAYGTLHSTHMKLTIAFLSIVLTLGLGACSSSKTGMKKVNLATCEPGDAGKPVHLQENSFEPGGRVVRLAH
jgi:hypothetical protein